MLAYRSVVDGKYLDVRGENEVRQHGPCRPARAQVRLLAAALDLKVDDPANVIPSEVIALIQQQETIPSGAKVLRDNVPAPTARQQESSVVRFFRSGSFTLIQAKRIVDALALEKSHSQE